MSRLIHHDATGPQEIKPSDKSAWVCMCGLSQNYPFCDGSHNKARKEEPGKCYVYNKARTDVTEVRNDE